MLDHPDSPTKTRTHPRQDISSPDRISPRTPQDRPPSDTISLFFSPLPPHFSFFSLNFGGVLKTGTLKCPRLGSREVVWSPGGFGTLRLASSWVDKIDCLSTSSKPRKPHVAEGEAPLLPSKMGIFSMTRVSIVKRCSEKSWPTGGAWRAWPCWACCCCNWCWSWSSWACWRAVKAQNLPWNCQRCSATMQRRGITFKMWWNSHKC